MIVKRQQDLAAVDFKDLYQRTRKSKLIQYSLIVLGVAFIIRKVF